MQRETISKGITYSKLSLVVCRKSDNLECEFCYPNPQLRWANFLNMASFLSGQLWSILLLF